MASCSTFGSNGAHSSDSRGTWKPPRGVSLPGIGSARFWQARYDDAITAYEEVLHRNPNWALGYAHLGEALAFGGHKQEADLALRRAVELDPAGKQGGDVARNIQRLMAHGLI